MEKTVCIYKNKPLIQGQQDPGKELGEGKGRNEGNKAIGIEA